MNRQFKNAMTIILSVITVLSISLFGACGNGNGTAVVPADEDKIIENADGNPQDYGAKYVLYSALGKLKNHNTFEEQTEGKSQASKGVINYVQTISSRNVKNGDERYFESDSRSCLVTSTHRAFEKGDKIAFVNGDSDIVCVSADDYKAVYGVTPAKMLCGFLLKDDTVVKAVRDDEASTDEISVYNYEIDKEKGAALIALQMREFGKLNGLPKYSENIKLTLTIKNDFTPVKLEISEKYNISVALVGELSCEQSTVSEFSKFNEQVEIPYSEDYNEAIGSTPAKINPATGKKTDENLETIVSALLAQDVKNGVVLNGEVEYNDVRVPVAVSLKADVNSILNGDKPFAEAVSATISALPSTRAINVIYDNHKLYINVGDLKYVISTNMGGGDSVSLDFGEADIMSFIKVSRDENDENVYKIELSDDVKPLVKMILQKAGVLGENEDFSFAVEFYIVNGRVGTVSVKFTTPTVSVSLNFAVSDKRYVLPADLSDYKVIDRRDFDVKLNLFGFETEGKVVVSCDFLKAADPDSALEIDARLNILSQKVSIYELAKMFDENVGDELKATDGADEVEFVIKGGKAYVIIYKQGENVYAKAFDLPELNISDMFPGSSGEGDDTVGDDAASRIAAIVKAMLGASIESNEDGDKFVYEIKLRDEVINNLMSFVWSMIPDFIIENVEDATVRKLFSNPEFIALLGFDRTLDKLSLRYETSMDDEETPGEFILEIAVATVPESENEDPVIESVVYLGIKKAELGEGSAISAETKEIIKKLSYV